MGNKPIQMQDEHAGSVISTEDYSRAGDIASAQDQDEEGMLSAFQSRLFQLPLIATTWTSTRDRYEQEKQNSMLPVRFLLSVVEQTFVLLRVNIVRPMIVPFHHHFDQLDGFLCSHVDTLRYFCPIVDQTKDQVSDRYSQLFVFPLPTSTNSSTSVNTQFNPTGGSPRVKHPTFLHRYFQFVTSILMLIEMYSKYIQNELNEYVDITRNLWKNLNMADGRSLDEVESYSEKLLLLGRRFIGNYRQLMYLIRYQFKRSRRMLFSCLHLPVRFHSIVGRIAQHIHLEQILDDCSRGTFLSSKQRIHGHLEALMVHATKHPWMTWITPLSNQSFSAKSQRPTHLIRPMFFVSSTNTSDCSGADETVRDSGLAIFQSTPYRRNQRHSPSAHPIAHMENIISDISSSSSDTLAQSFDVQDIVRQVSSQSQPTSYTVESIDQEEENRVIAQAFYESDDQDITPQQQQQQQPMSVFDLSPMLASGCAV